ncbi:arylsulfatase [Anseongella ginsenosidimutans]|uniref:Arylsulfatase n=2 Tax=Anseongella ginsenosidimutans TaxID=496056 RepID=A0A4V2UTU1_9SPHI|nr:sulfatase-like hydrolase/transferase [Anseongella ginsenosidimutans]TCS87688.1 arylsulfatase [Anseongella ginsenosidimutans]
MTAVMLLLIFHAASGQSQKQEQKQPNILIIMADDMGYSDLGCYGGEVASPNLDNLAEQGLRYKQFYNAARCCPSRAALMTGLYPHQAGMGWMAAADLGTPEYAGTLNNRAVTIAEVLKTAGYRTYMTGKWHLTNEREIDGKVTGSWPVHRGFDRYFGIIPGGANYFTPTVYSNDSAYKAPEDFYLTNAISDTSVKYIKEHFQDPGKPFFMYVAYTAPHWPLHALEKEINKYKQRYRQGWDAIRKKRFERQQNIGLFSKDTRMAERDAVVPAWNELNPEKQEEMAMRMAIYAAQITIMDQGIGRIIDKLKETGQLDNTLIFFLSDNGACAEFISSGKSKKVDGTKDTFESYRISWANAGSTPFREYKHYTHEGGIATPLIVHWPAGIKEALNNTLVSEYGHITDLMATCIDVSGAAYPRRYKGVDIHPLEGKSLVPHFSGKTTDRGKVFWEHEANIAMRDGKWKLVAKTLQDEKLDTSRLELYNLEEDPVEQHNLAAEKPALLRKMYTEWLEWAERIHVFPLDTREYGARMQAYRRMVNGTFDDNLGGWKLPGKGTVVTIDTTGKISGGKSARIRVQKQEGRSPAVMAWPFRAKKGESFSIRFLARSEGSSSFRVTLERTGANTGKIIDEQVRVSPQTGEFIFKSAAVPEPGNYRIAFYTGNQHSSSGEDIWIDDIKLIADEM